jgi:excisionase family DNA binding protein
METTRKTIAGARALAEALGVGVTTAEGLIRRREIPSIRLGRRVLIEISEIDAFLRRLKAEQSVGEAAP